MKRETIELESNGKKAKAILLTPDASRKLTVILAHGAGGNMHSDFLTFFHQKIADAGYPCMKFNFFYSEAKRKAPDPQPLLLSCYKKAIEAAGADRLVIGGKSMGGRMSSYVADIPQVAGLLFLGYPLHAPGKTDQTRDQHLYSIHKPMFFASGTKDPFARLDLLQKTIKKIGKSATSYLVEGGGHSFDVPKTAGDSAMIRDAVAQAAIGWLNSTF